ncbi:TetR/AcrR family transcriptional regulator C-terminal domain-containing protein [Nonomuraea roseoviolacea subsp. roseoviolacea]|uniref:AcrR family transcriptional regulator n=1 Tax=Nonomuraea roseoviolacea subsp. carminata TaxID=160689 RepID=A0ABT1JZR9_9ACTN|nr:TetR/AcrR family transcriptional regulator C-terminal domain-containing protein [Nonomuraea roseoviolacea]MCP2347253.1 AcrR family transcriptional regulator [Nonomuraea roseoviolacea subsp. carminata]
MAARREAGEGDPTLIWERPEPPSRPAPSPLSRERIVRAAIELADADGLEAVSLRKVAAALDAGPMRLYGYLSTKEELLDLMADAVYSEIPPPVRAGDDWRGALRSLAHGTRDAALRHEWFADLLSGRPHLGPNALARGEASLAALDGAPGFEHIDTIMLAVNTVNVYVIGALQRQIADLRAARTTGMDEREWQHASYPYLARMLATGRYPTLARFVRDASHADADSTFEAGLDCVLDGIAARLPRP